MPCYHVHLPSGGYAIVKTSGKRLVQCQCGALSQFQCDWKTGKDRTCDRHLCPAHALEVGPEKHLCEEHQRAYAKWKEGRDSA